MKIFLSFRKQQKKKGKINISSKGTKFSQKQEDTTLKKA